MFFPDRKFLVMWGKARIKFEKKMLKIKKNEIVRAFFENRAAVILRNENVNRKQTNNIWIFCFKPRGETLEQVD